MLLRIGEKIVNPAKIHKAVDDILGMRHRGLSQQEIAEKTGIDRSVISRLETMGEVRKGGRIALVGHPVSNCAELAFAAKQEGVDYCFLLSGQERWEIVQSISGLELFNKIMGFVEVLRTFDVVIFIGSDKWIKLAQTLLDNRVIGVQIGETPIETDKSVNVEDICAIIHQLHT